MFKKAPPRPVRWLAAVCLGAGVAAALGTATARSDDPTPVAELPASGDVTVRGTVEEVWDRRFALHDETGSVLVELAPAWYHDFTVEEGEELIVDGEIDSRTLAAYRVHRADGDTVEIRPEDGPAPWAGRGPREGQARPGTHSPEGGDPRDERPARATEGEPPSHDLAAPGLTAETVEALIEAALDYGFVAFDEIEREGPREAEVEGWLEDGWKVEVDFDLRDFRTLSESRERSDEAPGGLSADDIRRALRIALEQGVHWVDEIELENGYVEIEGWSRDGREIEVEITIPGFRIKDIDWD